jgi:hypothetical protein
MVMAADWDNALWLGHFRPVQPRGAGSCWHPFRTVEQTAVGMIATLAVRVSLRADTNLTNSCNLAVAQP